VFNIFEQMTKTDLNSKTSRQNAQDYLTKLMEAIEILKDVHNKNNSNVRAVKLTSTDTVAISAPVEIGGKNTEFKMAFSHGSTTPYAVEIIESKECK